MKTLTLETDNVSEILRHYRGLISIFNVDVESKDIIDDILEYVEDKDIVRIK